MTTAREEAGKLLAEADAMSAVVAAAVAWNGASSADVGAATGVLMDAVNVYEAALQAVARDGGEG